jgi:DHA1 family bicyclomycin/chloramphenicol resistance-like MFS transporter
MGLLKSPVERMSRTPGLVLLVSITMSGTFPIHLFVPALPGVVREFHATAAAAQLTITLYIVGLSIGQLVYGPISDRFGRRPVLLLGLALYTIASVSAALSPSLGALVAARVAEALGGCVGLVLGRAIARDGIAPDLVTRRLAILSLAMSLSPALAPMIGAQLAEAFGWRWVLGALSIASGLVLCVTALTLPETHAVRSQRPARAYAVSYVALLRSRAFASHALGGAFATTSFFAFVAASPFIFIQQLGVSTRTFGFVYLCVIVGLGCGSLAAKYIVGRMPATRVLISAAAVMIIASLGLLVAFFARIFTPTVVTSAMLVFIFGTGLASPFALSGAINSDAAFAGSASGLYGFIQMGFGALCTGLVALGGSNPAIPMILILLAASVASLIAFSLIEHDVAGRFTGRPCS